MFNETMVSHSQYRCFRCRFSSAVPFFFLNKELNLHEGAVWFLIFTTYLFLPFLGESYTISLYYIILKPSCHTNILWKNEGKLVPPSASRLTATQRTCQLHKGMHFSCLCCSKLKILHKQYTAKNW